MADRVGADERSTTMALATYVGLSLDCDDPAALSAFYTELLGMEVSYSSDEFVYLGGPGNGIGFVKVEKYVPPT
ncbi:MAG TPA: VOC family protein, partial [Actinoplanes sp.]|nr:VOC family protein [Actinoplanes sp.]